MNPKKLLIYTVPVAAVAGIAALLLSANSQKATAAPTPAKEEAWSFKDGRGVSLSETAARALGIQTADVAIADIVPERAAVSVQVYRSAAEDSGATRKAAGSFFLPSEEAEKLIIGQTLDFRDRDGSAFEAKVMEVKTPGEGNGGLTEVLASITDPEARLRVGDFVQAHIAETSDERLGVTAIPSAAVVDSVKGAFVYAENGGSFLRTPVQLGAEQNGTIEIVDGLFEGDVIVASGASDLWLVELQAVNGGKACADGH